jgi:PAS domain S-box-containing protein
MIVSELLNAADANDFTRDLLASIGESTPDFIFAKDINSRMVFANQAVLKTMGKSWEDIRGKSDDQWHDNLDEGRTIVAADARIMAQGTSESLEEVVTTADGPQTYLSTKWPLRAADGRVIGLFGISKNITARKAEEQLRQLLVDELDHRVRNTLALVQVIARQSLKPAAIDKAIWQAFEGRIQAMADAHTILTRESWEGGDVRRIVGQALAIHGKDHGRRFDISGDDVWIDAGNALALAMALHELCTNALKYGALSVPEGRVAIRWQIAVADGQTIFDFEWQESGGPAVVAPARRGFGSKLIETAFGPQGRDMVRVDYAPAGVIFHARLKLGTRSAAE